MQRIKSQGIVFMRVCWYPQYLNIFPEVCGFMILVLGRFQPMHKGHLKGISDAYLKDKELVIAVGSSDRSNTRDNPFSYSERKSMISAALKGHRLKARVVPVPDIPDDASYVSHILKIVHVRPDKVITENPLTDSLFRKAGITVNRTARYFDISATGIRERMASGADWRDFVPRDVARYIDRIGGEQRVRDLFISRGVS